MNRLFSVIFALLIVLHSYAVNMQHPRKSDVLKIIELANNYWQKTHPSHGNYFWNRAVYHVGNMEAYRTTGNAEYLAFSKAWSERNDWSGPKDSYWFGENDVPSNWINSYGENNVLFGDCQICFQIYSEIHDVDAQDIYLERAKQVLDYQVATDAESYIWWADGIFMLMPSMSHMYIKTGNVEFLNKMYAYWRYAVDLMWDTEEHLFYRDGSYVYPGHSTVARGKDFWARGDGWVFAALARVLKDFQQIPYQESEILLAQYNDYVNYYNMMAKSLKDAQQPEGYWSRSILDVNQAPGYESTGTELMLYGFLWGVNNGYFTEEEYGETIDKAWRYLSEVALQYDGSVGYMQPIGSSASPGTYVGEDSQADFGVGGFLLAACEMYRYATEDGYEHVWKTYEFPFDTEKKYTIQHCASGLYMNIVNDGSRVILSETPTEVMFVASDAEGQYYITNGTEYVGMAGTNAWTMSAISDKATTWTLNAISDGVYSIKGINGCIGTDDTGEGAYCYGDKGARESKSAWIVNAVEEPDFIQCCNAANLNKSDAVYDLTGKRVDSFLPNHVYIKDKKKYVIR